MAKENIPIREKYRRDIIFNALYPDSFPSWLLDILNGKDYRKNKDYINFINR